MHHNENRHRQQATKKDGEKQYTIAFPKTKKGGFSVKPRASEPTFGKYYESRLCTNIGFYTILITLKSSYRAVFYKGFVDELMADVVNGDFDLEAEKAEVPKPLCAEFFHPIKKEAVLGHVARFDKVNFILIQLKLYTLHMCHQQRETSF